MTAQREARPLGKDEAHLYRIDAPRMKAAPCFGIVVRDGVVIEAANIARWTFGKRIDDVVSWYRGKGATVSKP